MLLTAVCLYHHLTVQLAWVRHLSVLPQVALCQVAARQWDQFPSRFPISSIQVMLSWKTTALSSKSESLTLDRVLGYMGQYLTLDDYYVTELAIC
jgi:hypothetical protein